MLELRASGPVLVGKQARFQAVASDGAASSALTYRWDWEGRGSYAASSALSVATHVFKRAGRFVVGVLATNARGERLIARRLIIVVASRHSRAHARSGRKVRHRGARPVARTAGDASVTIKDFSFGPSTITIHAGETVTWVNQGPSKHTATGQGFNTGILGAGQSGSHVFTSPGTFSYICSIHPFMHATVIVLASASPNSTGERPSTPTKSAGSAPAEPRTRGPELPNTGMNLLGESLLGLGLLLLGALLVLSARGRSRS